MKMIIAYIKPHKLAPVTLALHHIEGLSGMSVSDARGFGRGKAKNAPHRIVEDLVDYIPCIRIEIFCSEEIADNILEEIEKTAHTGLKGDGKIYVLEVANAVRIATGERGKKAI